MSQDLSRESANLQLPQESQPNSNSSTPPASPQFSPAGLSEAPIFGWTWQVFDYTRLFSLWTPRCFRSPLSQKRGRAKTSTKQSRWKRMGCSALSMSVFAASMTSWDSCKRKNIYQAAPFSFAAELSSPRESSRQWQAGLFWKMKGNI